MINTPRRNFVKIIVFAGLSTVMCVSLSSCNNQCSEKSVAFALIGGKYHNPEYLQAGFGKMFEQELGITIDYSVDVSQFSAQSLQGYKLLIFFRDTISYPQGIPEDDNYDPQYALYNPETIVSDPPIPDYQATAKQWMTEEQGKAIKDFVQNGGSVLFYHQACIISKYCKNFQDVIGAIGEGHPPLRPFKVHITNHDHPITKGVNDFMVTDEQHFVRYRQNPEHVLIKSINEDGHTFKELGSTCEAGWAYDYGKGRVCYLEPGHTLDALWNPEYQKLQKNTVLWLLREN